MPIDALSTRLHERSLHTYLCSRRLEFPLVNYNGNCQVRLLVETAHALNAATSIFVGEADLRNSRRKLDYHCAPLGTTCDATFTTGTNGSVAMPMICLASLGDAIARPAAVANFTSLSINRAFVASSFFSLSK